MSKFSFMVLATVAVCPLYGLTQDTPSKVEILHADVWKYDASFNEQQRLLGNVRLRADKALMFCDSAWVYQSGKKLEAFGQVRIEQGDSLDLRADRLLYDSEDRVARLFNNVYLTNGQMNLTTSRLDYDRNTDTGTYTGGGTITGQNGDVLTSRRGLYYARSGVFHFQNEVSLINPEYKVTGDTLHYLERTSESLFFGPTVIRSADSDIYCERGSFNSITNQGRFFINTSIISEGLMLKADSLFYDGKTGVGNAFGHVEARDSADTYLVSGGQGIHNRTTGITTMTRRALMIKPFGADTLYLHAARLQSRPDSAGQNVIYASGGARFYKSDLQGRCDSLRFSDPDSLISFISDPVIWSQSSQITGDTIFLHLTDNEPNRLEVNGNGKIMSLADDTINFNQIAGRQMTGLFDRGEITNVLVTGNAVSLYFPVEKQDSIPVSIGLNRVECGEIKMILKNLEPESISFFSEPKGSLTPLSLTTEGTRMLTGFVFRNMERPINKVDVFRLPVRSVEVEKAESNRVKVVK